MSARTHERCDRELQRHLKRNDYGSRRRTPEQAEQDGDNPYTLLNLQLAGVERVKRWTQEEFDEFQGDPNNSVYCDRWARNLHTLMSRRRIFPEPQQKMQPSVPETVPHDEGAGIPSPDAWTNATQDLHGSTNEAPRSTANTIPPTDLAVNTIAAQISLNTSTNSRQGSTG